MARLQRELEVTVISAQDLKNVRFAGRAMDPYAQVWICLAMAGKVQTGADSGGGINPSWNFVLTLPCEDKLFWSGGVLKVALRTRGSFCDKLIGTVTVPLSDLSLQCKAADCNAYRESTLMSYQVRMKSGKPHGVLNLALKVGPVGKQAESAPAVPETLVRLGYQPSASSARHNQAPPNVGPYSQGNQTKYYPPQQMYPPQQVYPPQPKFYPAQGAYIPPPYQPQHAYSQAAHMS